MKHIIKNKGFTLVELAIVLVVIGLIVASVLVGQDIIRNAEVRKAVRQYEEFTAGIASFRDTYNGIPGDIAGNTNFGFTGDGDNSGLLLANTALSTENSYFWAHLGLDGSGNGAGLIPGTYTGANATTGNLNDITPKAATGTGNWGAFADTTNEVNFLTLGLTTPAAGSSMDSAAALRPIDALSIDRKIDDGLPNRGVVKAGIGGAFGHVDATADNDCTAGSTNGTNDNATDAIYETTSTTVACTLRFTLK